MLQFYIFCHFWGKSFSQLNCKRTLAKKQSTSRVNLLHSGIYFLRAVGNIYIHICVYIYNVYILMNIYIYIYHVWEPYVILICKASSSSIACSTSTTMQNQQPLTSCQWLVFSGQFLLNMCRLNQKSDMKQMIPCSWL